MRLRTSLLGTACLLAGAGLGSMSHAEAAPAAPLVTGVVSDSVATPLASSVPTALAGASDHGALASTTSFTHAQLTLKRSAARQAALDALVAAQTDPGSASYRRWLTIPELRDDYGPASADISAVTQWLAAKGFHVNAVAATGMSIDFSGSAAQVASAFHTELHGFEKAGGSYIAPAGTPSIPAALSPVVDGVVISNFFPKPMRTAPTALQKSTAAAGTVQKVGTSYTMVADGTTFYAVTPSDFATIYDLTQTRNGFLGASLTGQKQTIAVAEQTDINPADWNTFRSTFGLTGYKGTLSITHPGGCTDPGFTGDEGEAALDAEWTSAVAPSATIIEAACEGGTFGFGVMTSLMNLVEGGTTADSISVSYGGSEQGNGLTFLNAWANLVEEAAAQGISVFVSSGDGASDINDTGANLGTNGLSVNGLATPPNVTAVGGTDFYDTAKGQNSVYWASKNSTSGGSAKSYVPEIPWDNSCSNAVNYKAAGASGPIVNCNKEAPTAKGYIYQNVVGGSGGQSLIFPKPSFQSTALPGVPNDGVRDIPDISLFAANGFWNHFYLECMSNTAEGGVPCDFTNPADFLGSAFGGTSFAAPDFAGIAALVAQADGGRVGNMAPRLYKVAALQFANSVLKKSCLATNGNAVSAACVFYDETVGDNTVACQTGTPNCATNANSKLGIGVLSTSTAVSNAAFPATSAYDLATGLGSVNITNLIVNY